MCGLAVFGKRVMSDLQVEVMNSLHWDLAIPRDRVIVEEDHGEVTLHGKVERGYERACAEADARRVPGVVAVRNEIAVHAE
jgi:osmotically-inducible protein OsmY